jgi:hypothetical protein
VSQESYSRDNQRSVHPWRGLLSSIFFVYSSMAARCDYTHDYTTNASDMMIARWLTTCYYTQGNLWMLAFV